MRRGAMRLPKRLVITLLAAMLPTAAPAALAFSGSEIGGLGYGRDFALTDDQGHVRTLADYRGKIVVLSFGYTHCPDACPTLLSDLAAVHAALGVEATRVQVLFMTIDPARDTPAALGAYVRAFDPSFVGLTGDDAAIARTAKEFHVFYQKIDGADPHDYVMDHSVGCYVFDATGAVRLFFPSAVATAAVAADLRALLEP